MTAAQQMERRQLAATILAGMLANPAEMGFITPRKQIDDALNYADGIIAATPYTNQTAEVEG